MMKQNNCIRLNISDKFWDIRNNIINKVIIRLLNHHHIQPITIFAFFDQVNRVSENRLAYFYEKYTEEKKKEKQ